MITEEQFNKLYDENVTVKEQKEILSLIDKRFSYLMMDLLEIRGRGGWFDYSNGYGESDGYFNQYEYKEHITFDGDNLKTNEPFGYDIPTRWLWTPDAEVLEEYNREVQEYKNEQLAKKEKAKKTREELKIKKSERKQIINAKLTKEELKFISFK